MQYEDLIQDNVRQDQLVTQHIGDTRKPSLSLKHLNKLRKLRELKELEKQNDDKILALIYAQPPGGEQSSSPF